MRGMPRARRHAVLAGAMMIPILLAGLALGMRSASAASPSPSASGGKAVLRIGVTGDADTLSPFTCFETLSYETLTLNYNLLFDLDLQGKPRAQLAAEVPTQENGGLSADGNTWTIKLKPDLKWSDGEPLTAEDVAWTYEYYRKNQALLGNMSLAMRGIVKTTAIDETTIEIECTQPRADMLYAYLPIMPEHVWKNVPAARAGSSRHNKPPLIGSGPFTIAQWKSGSYLRMERNPNYWGARPAVDEIVFVIYQNAETMASDLESGTIDAAQGVLPAQFTKVGDLPGVEAIAYNYRNWDYLCFNCYEGASSTGDPVLRDASFRQALNWAVDREKLASIAYYDFAEPGTTIMTPDTWTDPDYHWQPPADQLYTFNLEKANQSLDEAGYAKNADGQRLYRGKPITLDLYALSDSPQEQTAGKLITGWFRQLGLKVRFEVVDAGALISRVWDYDGDTYAPDYDMFIWYWDGFSDPSYTLNTFTSSAIGSNDEPGWVNDEFDKLWNEQSSALDLEKRKQIIWKMQEIFYEETPEIALVYPRNLQAYNTERWTGWTRVQNGTGPAFWAVDNQDTYLNLRPVSAQTEGEGSSSTSMVVIAVVALAAVVVAAIAIRRRRRPRTDEE